MIRKIIFGEYYSPWFKGQLGPCVLRTRFKVMFNFFSSKYMHHLPQLKNISFFFRCKKCNFLRRINFPLFIFGFTFFIFHVLFQFLLYFHILWIASSVSFSILPPGAREGQGAAGVPSLPILELVLPTSTLLTSIILSLRLSIIFKLLLPTSAVCSPEQYLA